MPYSGPQPTAGEGLLAVAELVVSSAQLALWFLVLPFRVAWGVGVLACRGARMLFRAHGPGMSTPHGRS